MGEEDSGILAVTFLDIEPSGGRHSNCVIKMNMKITAVVRTQVR